MNKYKNAVMDYYKDLIDKNLKLEKYKIDEIYDFMLQSEVSINGFFTNLKHIIENTDRKYFQEREKGVELQTISNSNITYLDGYFYHDLARRVIVEYKKNNKELFEDFIIEPEIAVLVNLLNIDEIKANAIGFTYEYSNLPRSSAANILNSFYDNVIGDLNKGIDNLN